MRAFAQLAAREPDPLLVLPAGAAGAEAAMQAEIDALAHPRPDPASRSHPARATSTS